LLNIASNEFLIIRPEEAIRTNAEIIKLYKKKNDSDIASSDPRNFFK
jgi:hypothetical protein